jgi:hypothetical protein
MYRPLDGRGFNSPVTRSTSVGSRSNTSFLLLHSCDSRQGFCVLHYGPSSVETVAFVSIYVCCLLFYCVVRWCLACDGRRTSRLLLNSIYSAEGFREKMLNKILMCWFASAAKVGYRGNPRDQSSFRFLDKLPSLDADTCKLKAYRTFSALFSFFYCCLSGFRYSLIRFFCLRSVDHRFSPISTGLQ